MECNDHVLLGCAELDIRAEEARMSGRVNSGRLKEDLRSLYKHFGVYECARRLVELRLILDCGRSANHRRQTNIIKIDAEDHELSVLRGMRRQFLIFRLRSIFRNLGEKVWSAFKCWQAWPGTASSTTQLTVGEVWYWTVGLKKWKSRLYLIQARMEV